MVQRHSGDFDVLVGSAELVAERVGAVIQLAIDDGDTVNVREEAEVEVEVGVNLVAGPKGDNVLGRPSSDEACREEGTCVMVKRL